MTDAENAPTAPASCTPCRGTGRVTSNLGGSPTERPCPWCDGTGARVPGLDAQQRWREQADSGE